MSIPERLSEIASDWVLQKARHDQFYYTVHLVELALSNTDSPIEALVYYEMLVWAQSEHCGRCGGPKVTPQKQIDKYRVDFLIEWKGKNIIIECDGHDFHEKTKQQASKDKKRDRELSGLGYEIRRYTGSEIYKDPKTWYHDVMLLIEDSYREGFFSTQP